MTDRDKVIGAAIAKFIDDWPKDRREINLLHAQTEAVVSIFEAGAQCQEQQCGWVPIEDIHLHYNFDLIEEYSQGPCVAMCVEGDDKWEMVRLTREYDISDGEERILNAILTYGAYSDSIFLKDTLFTHFAILPPTPPKDSQ